MKKFLKNYLPLIILIFINLIVCNFIVHDYGESWDEQSLREYTDLCLKAYSHAFSDLEGAGFFDNNILRYYGPAYLIVATGVMSLLNAAGATFNIIESWHFSNFLIFQIGLLSIYSIGKRFIKPWAAGGMLLLFSTQPLFWGHAFINPKDIPFMSFFLASVASGFWMVDTAKKMQVNEKGELHRFNRAWISTGWKNAGNLSKRLLFTSAFLSVVFLVMMLFNRLIKENVIFPLISFLYNTDSASFSGSIFVKFASRAGNVPLNSYVDKAMNILSSIELFGFFLFFTILLILCGYLFNTITSFLFHRRFKPFILKTIQYIFYPQTILAGLILGCCISIRVIGPAAGLLIAIYLFVRMGRNGLPLVIDYLFIGAVVTYCTWPFLWGDAIHRYFEAMQVMSQFPFGAEVLYRGIYYQPDGLPPDYLPLLMGVQLTEPVIILFMVGLIMSITRLLKDKLFRLVIFLISSWLFVPLFITILVQPPLYDNFRQFFFIIPPIFLFAGIAIDYIFNYLKSRVAKTLIVLILISPGILADFQLHPYQYVYYNQFVGGVGRAYRYFEMDYWATSFKEATEFINEAAPLNARLITSEPVHIVRNYAREDLAVDLYPSSDVTLSDDYDFAVVTTRLEKDVYIYPDEKDVYQVERDGAVFAKVKRIH